MDYNKYDIFYLKIKYDENNTSKGRPVLLMDNDNKYNVFNIFKISTKNNNNKFNYPIKKWQEAGLTSPSYVRIGSYYTIDKKDLSSTKTGKLDTIDIKGLKTKMINLAMQKLREEKININKAKAINKIDIPDNVLTLIIAQEGVAPDPKNKNNKNIPKP